MANGQRPRTGLVILAVFLFLSIVGQAVPLYTDWLWFDEVGFVSVFTSILALRGWIVLGVGLVVLVFLFVNLGVAARSAPPDVLWELEDQLSLPGRAVVEPFIRRLLPIALPLIALVAGIRASAAWDTVVEFRHAVPFGRTDPLFGRDLGFYVFELPFWRLLYGWGMTLVAGTLVLTAAVYVFQRSAVLTAQGPRLAAGARAHLLLLGALLLGLRAVGFRLDQYDLLYSSRGVVFGASYTDVNATLPVLRLLVVLAVVCALVCAWHARRNSWRVLVGALVVLGVVWVGGLGVYPTLLQRLRVTPNELVAERPYIEHNIRMTRQAYGLDRVQERPFPVEETLSAPALERNALTIKNIRLWDHRPLLTTFGQLQEIRTYYKFLDVDNDRYTLGGEYRQVMLSPRELSYRHLPGQGGWINERLIYTHGYGLVVGPVNRISPEGLPEFFVKDIPPRSDGFPKISRPEIYYGEGSNDYVFVRTRAQELDYPSGEQNVYTRYAGRGGVVVSGLLRKLAFAIRFGEFKVLLSDDLAPDSRIMFHREIRGRVRQAAPFLQFDRDPYLVVTDDGRLVWMIDAYTTSDRYPYAQPVRGLGNYIRNSVKAVVDAFHGSVEYYIADPEDPIIRVYARAFPALFRPFAEMPKDLQAHVRYPEDLFTIQSQMFATYHMEDPQVFYNKEDLWTIPRRPQEGRPAQEMEPYYTIMRLPGEPKEEFVLLTSFNPSRRDNMIAVMVARADVPNYGALIVYLFPKQKLVFGPRQIDARIDQDPVISQQLSLWNQQGSRVLRGSLLAIPLDQSLIYVQPLYLSATEQGALPELRRVFVAYGNQIAMEPTLEQSLQRIFGARLRDEVAARPREAPAPTPPGGLGDGLRTVGQRAWEAFQRAQEALRRGDWAGYGQEQKRLEDALRQLQADRK